MPESFGARLRQRREERGVSLGAIARQTKIKESLLEGLERDDLSNWPSRIYRRAFIRAYADAIDLNPDAVVQEFLAVHPDPPEDDVLVALASVLDRGTGGIRPSSAIRSVVGSAIGSLSRRRRSTSVDKLVVTNGPLNDVPPAPVVDSPVVARSDARPGHAKASPADAAPGNGRPEGGTPRQAQTLSGRPPLATEPPIQEDEPGEEGLASLPSPTAPASDIQLTALAQLCTDLGRVTSTTEMRQLLQQAAALLDATGVVVWLADSRAEQLTPSLVHGYSDRVAAQLPLVRRDADNATAASFRSGQACTIAGCRHANGALVVPLLTPQGCAGVLAIELQRGREQTESLVAAATILAAFIGQLIRTFPSESGLHPAIDLESRAIAAAGR